MLLSMLLVALPAWVRVAAAHEGIVPILAVADYSQLPDAEPGAWLNWGIHPSTIAGVALWLAVYTWATGPLRRRHGWAPTLERRYPLCMWGAMAVILACLNGPIHHLSDNYLFSAHMVQHLLLTLLMPYLFIFGTPAWLVSGVLRGRGALTAVARAITRPIPAFLLYNVILAVWHVPRFYDHTMESHPVHIFEHLLFMGSAVICWWPVLGEAPELRSLENFGKVVYLFGLGLPMKALGAIITMAPDVLYQWYAHVPRVWGLDPMTDQRVGGIIMWVPAGVFVWGSIGLIFVRWYREESRSNAAPRSHPPRNHPPRRPPAPVRA